MDKSIDNIIRYYKLLISNHDTTKYNTSLYYEIVSDFRNNILMKPENFLKFIKTTNVKKDDNYYGFERPWEYFVKYEKSPEVLIFILDTFYAKQYKEQTKKTNTYYNKNLSNKKFPYHSLFYGLNNKFDTLTKVDDIAKLKNFYEFLYDNFKLIRNKNSMPYIVFPVIYLCAFTGLTEEANKLLGLFDNVGLSKSTMKNNSPEFSLIKSLYEELSLDSNNLFIPSDPQIFGKCFIYSTKPCTNNVKSISKFFKEFAQKHGRKYIDVYNEKEIILFLKECMVRERDFDNNYARNSATTVLGLHPYVIPMLNEIKRDKDLSKIIQKNSLSKVLSSFTNIHTKKANIPKEMNVLPFHHQITNNIVDINKIRKFHSLLLYPMLQNDPN